MYKTEKHLKSMIAVLIMVLVMGGTVSLLATGSDVLGGTAFAEDTITASGACGTNAAWKLDSEGKLTVYPKNADKPGTITEAPWAGESKYAELVRVAVIRDGLDVLSEPEKGDGKETEDIRLFDGCKNLRALALPATYTQKELDLTEFSELKKVVYAGTEEEWEDLEVSVNEDVTVKTADDKKDQDKQKAQNAQEDTSQEDSAKDTGKKDQAEQKDQKAQTAGDDAAADDTSDATEKKNQTEQKTQEKQGTQENAAPAGNDSSKPEKENRLRSGLKKTFGFFISRSVTPPTRYIAFILIWSIIFCKLNNVFISIEETYVLKKVTSVVWIGNI